MLGRACLSFCVTHLGVCGKRTLDCSTYGSIEIQLVDNGGHMVAFLRAESQSLISHFYVPARRRWECVWEMNDAYGSIEVQLVDNGGNMVALHHSL